MSCQNPLVTVYIPTYNRVELLKRAVDSVLNQTYTNLEVIIVDDCSTDGTHQFLKEIKQHDSRVRYFLKEKNSGACVSRNIAIENAIGEYITGLDDDDYYCSDRIEKMWFFWCKLGENKLNYSGVYTNYYIISKNRIRKSNVAKTTNTNKLKKSNCVGNQVFTKTNYFKEVGCFDKDMPAWQDYECWFRLVNKFGNMYCVPNSISYYMDESHENIRISTSNSSKIIDAYNLFIKKHKFYFNKKEEVIFYYNCIQYQQVKIELNDIVNSLKTRSFINLFLIYLKKIWKIVRI